MSVSIERRDRITLVTLSRPAVKNAVDAATARELAAAFREFDEDVNSDVAIFYGDNATFCAGADLKSIASGGEPLTGLSFEGDGPMGPSRMVLNKPVIAAISGYAVAGGLELALWCDLRVVEKSTVMGVFCRRWGVPLIDGGTVRLPRLIGHSRAMDLILTGRPVTAPEALQMGLANRLVADGECLNAALELADQLLRYPQTCLRSDRLSAYEQWDLPYEQAMQNEFQRGMQVIESKETVTGASRFASGKGRHGNFEDL
ncbi:MAG: enoyl-CoA hydratase [Halioglobus sp.]|jgi:enoyl-CoA hydratase